MMARTPMKRSSTLIDPESLKQRPISTFVRQDSTQTDLGPGGLSRRNSAHAKTLINFEEEIPGAPRGTLLATADNHGGMASTRSVFGVDTLWEKELAKLRDIEAREKTEEEARQKREAEDDGKKRKGRGKRKDKGKNIETKALDASPSLLSPSPSQVQGEANPAASSENPAAAQRRISRRPPPPPVSGDEEVEEEESDSSSVARRPSGRPKTDGWHSGSEDGGEPQVRAVGARRTTGSGSRFVDNLPPRFRALQQQQQLELEVDDDSEEDVPLVATIGRAAQRATMANFPALRLGRDDDSSDEEMPLSVLLDKTKQKLPSPTSGSGMLDSLGNFGSLRVADDDEDDKPLGLRVSRMGLSPPSHALSVAGGSIHQEEDDERPLALHPEQLRRSQYVAAAQQQQMMMQAQAAAAAQMQMQQSMMFTAPSIMSMSTPFYGPPMPMGPPMMAPSQMPSTPPPMQDTAKLNRVDEWRHNVAVEEKR